MIDAEAVRARLNATGLFEKVGRVDGLEFEFTATITDPLRTCNAPVTGCAGNDPSRYQWWIPAIALGSALDAGNGRALLGNVDSGLDTCNSDIRPALRFQFLGMRFDESNTIPYMANSCSTPEAVMDGSIAFPLGTLAFQVGHGMHVAGLMIGARDGVGGIGACPGCGLSAHRVPREAGTAVLPAATDAVISTAPTAINFSMTLVNDPTRNKDDKDIAEGSWGASLNAALDYDMVIVASIGNKNLHSILGNEAFPAAKSGVLSVGASDVMAERWHELAIDSRSGAFRNAGLVSSNILGRCFATNFTGGADECGSNFDTARSLPTIYAPGAQILSTLDRAYIGTGGCTVSAATGSLCPPPGNSDHVAPARHQYGNNGVGGVAGLTGTFVEYGTMTGTSMAAPLVTGTVGLLRSLNPLVSRGEVAILLDGTGSNGVNLNGKKIVNAGVAMSRVAGVVNGAQMSNRLIPVFSVCSRTNVAQASCDSVVGNRKWIYTTSPQVAQLAIDSRLFATNDSPQDFGIPAGSAIPYISAGTVGIGKGLTSLVGGVQTPWYLFPKAGLQGAGARNATASFYILSTSQFAEPVVPLWHLTSNCTSSARRHRYAATDATSLGALLGSADGCSQANLTGRQQVMALEGYIFASPGPGREALYVSLDNGLSDQVLALESEKTHSSYAGRSFGASPIGYVVPAVTYVGSTPTLHDTDGDGLVDGFEKFLGTNELTNQSDCEVGSNTSDMAEYPLGSTQASGSDPMTGGAADCRDLRLRFTYTGGPNNQLVATIANPVGPTASGGYAVNIEFVQPGIPDGALPPNCTASPPPGPLSVLSVTCVVSSLAVGSEHSWVFNMATPPPSGIATAQIGAGAFVDPVPSNNSAYY